MILLLSVSVSAQTTINGKQYKDLLWGKEQEFDVTDFPDGSFYKTPSDFIGTSGKLWKGPPPPSNGTFSYRDELVTNSGEFNNKALELIETGDLKNRDIAIDMLEKAVRFDPHFFPFRYNLGRLYQLKSFYEKAARQFEYAVSEVPEFYRTYIHIGKMYELQNQPDYAVQMYKQAARLNRFNIEALIFLGEHFLDGGLKNRAAYYFKTAL
ncbi:MAG: hypothetical protein K8R21_15915, partial [Leptospira sp.]|nr:hypothetical protein [Leptospira sp.]